MLYQLHFKTLTVKLQKSKTQLAKNVSRDDTFSPDPDFYSWLLPLILFKCVGNRRGKEGGQGMFIYAGHLIEIKELGYPIDDIEE